MTARCTVLMYHVIDAPRAAGEQRLCCPLPAFERQMDCLAENGWNVIPLATLVAALTGGVTLPERSAVITFDDGTACTRENAFPVLARHRFPATVFVVSGLVGARNEWMCRDGHPERAMLSAAQLRELDAGGVSIGSHTTHHVRLAGQPASVLRSELRDSRRQLEDHLGKPVVHFAYPYGSHDAAAVAAVRDAGYEAACSTVQGRNAPAANLFALRRTEVMGQDAMWQFQLKLRSGTHDMPPWSIPRAAAKRLLVRTGLLRARPAVGAGPGAC